MFYPTHNRRGLAASGEASLLADARCRLNPLVVRRFAPNGQWMISAAIVAGREASGNNKLVYSFWIITRKKIA